MKKNEDIKDADVIEEKEKKNEVKIEPEEEKKTEPKKETYVKEKKKKSSGLIYVIVCITSGFGTILGSATINPDTSVQFS